MSAEPTRKVPRFLSCLVKGPLGCFAFVAGASVVLVLLLPAAGGRFVDRRVEEWFEEHHAGQLELADAWVGSFYGAQRIESVILRDPDGDEVLRAEVRAPSLGTLFERRGPYGPVLLRIPVCRLAPTDAGTNLAAALAELPDDDDDPLDRSDSGLRADRPFEVALEIALERLQWKDAHGNHGALEELAFHGALVIGPEETRLALSGGTDPAAAEALSLRFEHVRSGALERWTCTLSGAPSALAGLLVPGLGPLVPGLGPRLDDVRCERTESRYELKVSDEGATFELSGPVMDDLVEGEGAAARVQLPCGDPRVDSLVATLVPLLSGLECLAADAGGSALHAARLENARWPLVGDASTLSGDLFLELAPARGELAPAFVALARDVDAPFLQRFRGGARIEDGELEFALFRLPTEQGWLQLDGTMELASGFADVRVTGERAGEAFDLGALAGTRGELERVAPEPPPLPEPPAEEESPEGDG